MQIQGARLESVYTWTAIKFPKNIFSFTFSDKFWTRLIIICWACFHIMTQKTTGLVELNLQWELYIFTLLFSSTGLLWLLVLWIWFKFFFIYPVSGFWCFVNYTRQQNASSNGVKALLSIYFWSYKIWDKSPILLLCI